MSEKIQAHHLSRKAVLYVRQSSPQQVMRNEESRRLQYGMETRLRELGWSEILVVDEDLGRSAAGATERSGFERMVADVCLGKVGAVAAREVSRFARNSRDWQQLVEVCRMVDTLLIDHESVYDARRGNDRLLLGLKGSLNEYELDILRLRSVEARQEKARRGELVTVAPAGHVASVEHGYVKDPDRRVQNAVQLVFEKFLELGSVRQTLMWFIEHGLEIPVREHGASDWEIVWKRPVYQTMMRILRQPAHAGIYAYGRTEHTVELRKGVLRKRIRRKPMEKWLALHYDHHEGYVDREQFERIQEMISRNATGGSGASSGAPRKGLALLAGLVRCRRCGQKLMVAYTGRARNVQRYICCRGALNNAESRCITFGGSPVDDAVSREVLRVVRPGAIEAAMLARQEAAGKQSEVVEALRLDLKAARYAADRAWKQYDATDPENRLVADELERRWNDSLVRVQELEERIDREQESCAWMGPPESDTFEGLAANLDQIWSDPDTDVRLKKRVVRALVEEVLVDRNSKAGEISLVIHWKGGTHTELVIACRKRGENSLHTSKDTVEAVRVLTLICSDDVIAGILNRNRRLTGRGNRWTRERVTSLRTKRSIPKHSIERQTAEGWMNLTQAAAYLGVDQKALRRAVERGQLEARHPLPDGPWIFKREDLDQPGASKVIEAIRRRRRGAAGHSPEQLSLF